MFPSNALDALKERYIAWQGSPTTPPWHLFQSDEDHHLIAQQRLPPGISCLRQPDLWDLSERKAWSEHLRSGQSGDLPPENRFQYTQPRPGVFDLDLRLTRAEEAEVHFEPESIAYQVRRNRMKRGVTFAPREDGLPSIPEAEPYQALTPDRLAMARKFIEKTTAFGLLEIITYYDSVWPHQVGNAVRAKTVLTPLKGRARGLAVELRGLSPYEAIAAISNRRLRSLC